MFYISKRTKIQNQTSIKTSIHISKKAKLEESSLGIGVSTTARIKWREYYSNKNMPNMSVVNNKALNDMIAGDFKSAEVIHRFKLKTGSIGEFRKSHSFYYLARITGSRYDILTIQSAYKEAPENVKKIRLSPEYIKTKWG